MNMDRPEKHAHHHVSAVTGLLRLWTKKVLPYGREAHILDENQINIPLLLNDDMTPLNLHPFQGYKFENHCAVRRTSRLEPEYQNICGRMDGR